MSRDGRVTLRWGDEDFTFRLGLDQWRRVQEKTGVGPGVIYQRLIMVASALEKGLTLGQAAAHGLIGDWKIDDVREVVLQGLIGGGRSEIKASNLVANRVDETVDFKENLALAYAIVKAGLGDVPDEPLGESAGEATATTTSPTESSASPGSTPTV